MQERLNEIFHPRRNLKQERVEMISGTQNPESPIRALTDVTKIVYAQTPTSGNKIVPVPVEARILTFVDGHLVGAKAYNRFVHPGISPRWSPHAPYSPEDVAGQMELDPSEQKGLLTTYGFSPENLQDLEENRQLGPTFRDFIAMESERYKGFHDHIDPKRFSAIVTDVLRKH